MAPCSVQGCIGTSRTLGLCPMHYKRLCRHGTTDEPVDRVLGQISGSLIVRRRAGHDAYGRAVVQLDCDCGNSVIWEMRKFRNPDVPKHCGCGIQACMKAPAAAYGKSCPCARCRSLRSAARRATGRKLIREAALERARLAREPDEVAVQRAMKGDMTSVRKVDMREAAKRLLASGRSQLWIAERLGVSDRTINRYSVKWREVA